MYLRLNKEIQIVSFNVPYPPDYGGVIDVFYKIKSLHQLGFEIILHTFEYGRSEQPELEKYCKKVYYYKRKRSVFYLFSRLPFIIISRKNKTLLNNLLKHQGTILFEGIHTTYWLHRNALRNRHIIVRTHNIEYLYYQGLAITEKNIFRRIYFMLESSKLRKYEVETLANANHIVAISPNDFAFFKQYLNPVKLVYPFHGNDEITSKTGKGNYILIHGDLSVPENIQSIEWLIENVIAEVKHPFVVAGKNPARSLQKLIALYKHVKLISNPSETEMDDLIAHAHINLIHSFHPQGMKLKLLNSLYKGRFVIVNPEVIDNTGIEKSCYIAYQKEDYIIYITMLMDKTFDEKLLQERKELLASCSMLVQANRIAQLL